MRYRQVGRSGTDPARLDRVRRCGVMVAVRWATIPRTPDCIQVYKNTGIQAYKNTGIQAYKDTSIHVYRSRVSELRIDRLYIIY